MRSNSFILFVGNIYNMIDRTKFDILVGLRNPSSSPMEKHGAVIAAKRFEDGNIQICAFHDGAEIKGFMCSHKSMNSQLNALKDRKWVLMEDSDIYVTTHGMGLPQTPFWERCI